MRNLLLILFALFLSCAGCSTLTGSSSSNTQDPGAPPQQASFYYDFKDIQVPEEMEIQTDKSSITPVETGKVGVMRFQGRAEPISLFDFFSNTMPKDGWTLLAYQKYQRYLLVFSKDTRICVITVEEAAVYYTKLEVWVCPRVPNSAAPAYSTGSHSMSYPTSGSGSGMSGAPLGTERTLNQ